MAAQTLTTILQALQTKAEQRKPKIADLLAALRSRGFGPLLILPALITILPTGAIPGIPALCGLLVMLICGQMLFGREHPWIPKRLRQVELVPEKLNNGITRALKVSKTLDKVFKPRLKFLTTDLAKRCIAGVCIVLASLIVALGFVPFAPVLPAISILLFAFALSMNDGLMMTFGLILALVGMYMSWQWLM